MEIRKLKLHIICESYANLGVGKVLLRELNTLAKDKGIVIDHKTRIPPHTYKLSRDHVLVKIDRYIVKHEDIRCIVALIDYETGKFRGSIDRYFPETYGAIGSNIVIRYRVNTKLLVGVVFLILELRVHYYSE